MILKGEVKDREVAKAFKNQLFFSFLTLYATIDVSCPVFYKKKRTLVRSAKLEFPNILHPFR